MSNVDVVVALQSDFIMVTQMGDAVEMLRQKLSTAASA
jgi:hypothetical protein